MGKPKMYGINSTFTPNSKMDMRYRRKLYDRERCLKPSKYLITDRFGGHICGWDTKKCGYPPSILRSMQDAGYLYYINGKL